MCVWGVFAVLCYLSLYCRWMFLLWFLLVAYIQTSAIILFECQLYALKIINFISWFVLTYLFYPTVWLSGCIAFTNCIDIFIWFKWMKTYSFTHTHTHSQNKWLLPLVHLSKCPFTQSLEKINTFKWSGTRDNKINEPPSPNVYQTLLRGLIDWRESKPTPSNGPLWTPCFIC